MILLVTNEDYPVIVLTLQRYKIIWENASEIRFLTSINTFVKIINTFFYGGTETILFRFTETPQTETHPCLILQRYEIISLYASDLLTLTFH